jgi:predicted N-acetyltransferase YhbS
VSKLVWLGPISVLPKYQKQGIGVIERSDK